MGGTTQRRTRAGAAAARAVAGVLALLVVAACGQAPETARVADGRSASTPPSTSPSAEAARPPVPSIAAPSPAVAPTRSPVTAAPARPGTALALLATLPVKGRAPRTGYDRDLFGPAWADTDRNGCDTRNDVLARDLTGEAFRPGTRGCVVLSGTLAEPYTGRTVAFSKADASAVQVDHVVALSDAWQKGAQQWTAGKRLAFANDPLNLLAVDGPTNAAKGDGDAATWLPPHRAYRCPMVARQVAVKAKYGLAVTAAERDAIARVLGGCPGQPAPTGGTPTTAPVTAPRPATSPAPRPAGGGVDPDYGTCREARAAGAGPYVQGRDPEYDWYRDGDGDGVVCE